jgi:hypothetical protein
MEVNYINYFNEFEREYEVLKNASDDVFDSFFRNHTLH